MTVKELITSLEDLINDNVELANSPVVKLVEDTGGYYYDIDRPCPLSVSLDRNCYHVYRPLPRDAGNKMILGVII